MAQAVARTETMKRTLGRGRNVSRCICIGRKVEGGRRRVFVQNVVGCEGVDINVAVDEVRLSSQSAFADPQVLDLSAHQHAQDWD